MKDIRNWLLGLIGTGIITIVGFVWDSHTKIGIMEYIQKDQVKKIEQLTEEVKLLENTLNYNSGNYVKWKNGIDETKK
jgi:hypothetical protein